MLADQMPCNARNCFPGQVFNSRSQKINLSVAADSTCFMRVIVLTHFVCCSDSYGKNVEVDYRGTEVTVANFITVLTGMGYLKLSLRATQRED